VANNILAAKARKRITATDSTFEVRVAVTAVWAMKAKTKMYGLKDKEKNSNEQANIFGSERGGVLPQFYRC